MATHMTDVPSGPAAKLLTSSSLLTETILTGECAGTANTRPVQHKASAQVRKWYRFQIQVLHIKRDNLEVNVRMST